MPGASSPPVDPAALYDLVVDVISETRGIPRSRLSPESRFEDLAIDSMAALGILFALEERVDLVIPDDVARGIGSVEETVKALVRLMSRDGDEPSA